MDVERLFQLQRSLDSPMMEDDALRDLLERNYAGLEAMAQAWQAFASEHYPPLRRFIATPGGLQSDRPQAEPVDFGPLMLTPLVRT
jgi:hypothetical protein